jgi:hypothetical protein
MGTGRVCGTSARNAPSVTSRSAPRSRATPITAWPKVRQRLFGSVLVKITTSRPSTVAWLNSLSGHSITRLTPSTRRTVGRFTWKS